MAYVEAVLGTIGLLKDMWSSIYKCFNYRKILDKNCKTLDEKMERLKCREQDVCTELQNAQYHRKKGKKEVENWLNEVQKMKNEVEMMEREVRKGRCFSRLEFLRQSEENIEKVDDLLERGRFPEGILIDVVRDEGKALVTTELVGENTAKRNMEEIWECIEEAGTLSIGVWGMGGIGKTTIATHIHNRLLEKKDAFGAVYWVTVSKDSSIPKLQDAVAGKINLDLSKEEDERIRSALLFESLQKEKNFVLIFDDVWEVYPPEAVGIPIGGGKLIVTTRSREVCQKMGCKKIIKVECLDKEEAWKLFNKTLDRYNLLSPKEEDIAKDIVEECAGLPLAIVTTARSMSVVYDIAEWRNALNELRDRVKGHTINMVDDVFEILEFSYSRLNDEKLQECLLYCALFPEDYEIRRIDLIDYWIAEGLVEEMGSKQDERDRGHAILNKLENVSLLERCWNRNCVKMHDVIRDMAINITGRSCRFMVKTGRNNIEDLLPTEQTKWSNNNNNLERVSLINSRLSASMSVPNFNCPKLFTLLLQTFSVLFPPREDEGLPNSFFMNMTELKVLDLSHRNIEFLPDSIYELVNLRALILFRCEKLKQIGSLEKLTALRKLDLRENKLKRLPVGIDKLVHLKEFYWISGAIEGRPITPSISHLLPNLVHLQSLIVHDYRFSGVGMKELSGLRKLEILSISFSDLHNLNTYFRKPPCPRLTHYCVRLNEVRNPGFWYGVCKVVVRNCRLIGGKENEDHRLVLPANLQVLELADCKLFPNGIGLMDVSSSLKTTMDLKVCKIIKCEGIEYVWWADDCIASSVKTLYLEDLPDLGVLFKLRPTENIVSCSGLKHLFVTNCHSLKYLFTAELVKSRHLQNLESIVVYGCDEMEDIIIEAKSEEEEGINNDLILCFPKLRSLYLGKIPKLKSIWKGEMTCASIRRLAVVECPNLRRLPLSSDTTTDLDGEVRASTPPLEEIWGETQWWDEVEWEPKSLFQPLFEPIRSRVDTLILYARCREGWWRSMREICELVPREQYSVLW